MIIGTALSLGVSTVKASFVAGVAAAFVALVPILGGIDVEEELEDEGQRKHLCMLIRMHTLKIMPLNHAVQVT